MTNAASQSSTHRDDSDGMSGGAALLSMFLGLIFFPVTLLASWVVVHPQEEKVILVWGKLRRIYRLPGLYWVNVFGRKIIPVTTKRQTLDITRTTVADANANPIIIAGVVTYEYIDSRKVALDVENAHEFVKTQAMAVLKQVASKYPYEAADDGHSLKAEAEAIGEEMVRSLQAKVEAAGTRILSYELSDLSYAPEIAQSMLVRQQAQALVDARKIVVDGAVEIVNDSVGRLAERGLGLDESQRARLITNLLTVICGDANVQPTYNIGSSDGNGDDRLLAAIARLEIGILKLAGPK
jgi:regulator of protease activity HflC (stomatin/prohibitin superfamily)